MFVNREYLFIESESSKRTQINVCSNLQTIMKSAVTLEHVSKRKTNLTNSIAIFIWLQSASIKVCL